VTKNKTTVTSTVAKREKLETALAQAEAARAHLEAALTEAQAALVNTVTDTSKVGADWAEASAKVEKARVRCRQLRAAFLDPEYSKIITRSRERLDRLSKQSEELPRQELAPALPSIQSGDCVLRGENKSSQGESRRRQSNHRFINGLTTSPRIRETIGLLALVLAYLQYYYFDVQLRIMSLPWIFTFRLR
jgi:hypothetical protein